MKRPLFIVRTAALAAVLAGLAVAPAQAATSSVDTSWCSAPPAFQPFLAWGERNWYAMVPGESLDNFAGSGWALTGGAKITTQTLADGKTGLVLDMPSGSTAVSPEMCIGDGYPIARTLIRYGSGSSGSVAFTPYDLTANTKLGTMQLPGRANWSLTPPVNVLPGAVHGWHIMQFSYVAGGRNTDLQIYDFAVDPRMRG
jgi:hypothetical protein